MADDNLIHPDGHKGNRVPEEKKNQAPNQPDSKPQCAETPIPVVPPKLNFPPTERHQCKKRYKYIKEEIKYWFEVAAIIGGLAGLYLIWLQYNDMTRATDASVKQSKALIAQSEIMQRQLDEMKQARIQDERAWVFVTVPNNALSFSVTNGVLNAIMKNVGKTPALLTSEYGCFTENPAEIQRHDPIGNKDSLMIIPNQEATLKVTIPLNAEARILNNVRFYIYGTVYYSDISGNNHWSQFCFSITDKGAWMVAQNFHGSCDDLESDQIK